MTIKEKYNKKVVPEMKDKFGLKNALEVPRIDKVVVNVGIGKFLKDGAVVEDIAKSLSELTGQKPLMAKARQSIAGFKTRQGQEIGIKITLRGKRMWDFIERLVSAALPRVRDFRGIKLSAIDGSGNLNLGIKEHLIFPEILPEKVKNVFPLQVTIVTTVNDKEKGLALFKLLGFPIE